MWNCRVCREEIDDQFDCCWRCSSGREISDGEAATLAEKWNQKRIAAFSCLRCKGSMEYVGPKKFHEGTRLGVLGEVAELFVSRLAFDVYACPKCGKVEFFMDGIGEDLRSRVS